MLFSVQNRDTQILIADHVETADTWKTRLKGLLGKTEMAEGYGLLIKPCRQVHTFFMKFPIDVLFLDKENQVVGLHADLAPWRLSAYHPSALSTLELATGAIERSSTTPGHRLVFSPSNPEDR